jgi:hypothetical protein
VKIYRLTFLSQPTTPDMRSTKCLLAALALFLYQCQIFAQQANYSGTWVLNMEKTQFEHKPEGLISSVFVIEQVGEKFKLTRYHIFGDKKKKISFKMKADGKTKRVKMLFKAKLEKNQNDLRSTLWRKNFLNIVNYKFGNSQNELIADEVMTSKQNSHHNLWVFEREVPK